MTDTISISQLELWLHIGIDSQELRTSQKLLIDITLFFDLQPAGQSDKLSDTIDYRPVAQLVLELQKRQFATVECLAETIASSIKKYHPVEKVTVRVTKPGALIDLAKCAIIHIER